MQRIRKALNNQRGVTLIELLAVVVILGIVAAVAVPAVMNQITTSRSNVDESNAAIIRDAVERAIVDSKVIPASSDLVKKEQGGTTVTDELNLISNGYLKEIPVVNETGKTYFEVTIKPATASGGGNVIVITK